SIVLVGNFLKDNAPDALFVSGVSGTTLAIAQGGSNLNVVTTSQNITQGQSAMFQVSLSPTLAGRPQPTGTVSLLENQTTLATGTLASGAVSIAVPGLATGSHTLTAAYSGDTNFNPNTALANIVVSPVAAIALSSSANSL